MYDDELFYDYAPNHHLVLPLQSLFVVIVYHDFECLVSLSIAPDPTLTHITCYNKVSVREEKSR